MSAQLLNALAVEPILDANLADCEEEWRRYFRRQQLMAEIVRGEMHPDDFLDCLMDDGRSPDLYLEQTEEELSLFL